MKPFKAFSFFTLIITPLLILGYQNCSDFNNTSISKGLIGFPEFSPAAFSSASDLGYTQDICAPTAIGAVEVFNSKTHACITATNSCELDFLIRSGYTEENTQICDTAEDFDSEDFAASLTLATPEDFGFATEPDRICSMQFQRLLSIKYRKCVDASNGCMITFLKSSHGFITDHTGICN